MQKIGVDEYSAAPGEVLTIKIESVNFVINADLDPLLTPGPATNFSKSGSLTMGGADTTFVVGYNFPVPLPAGGKYTRTVTGPGGFVDGPFDVVQIGAVPNVALPYMVKVAAPATKKAPQVGTGGDD